MRLWTRNCKSNPFVTAIVAHLKAMATLGNNQERKEWKLRLVRSLFERGYDREQIRNLFRFIEWMMALPQEIQQEFKAEIKRLEEEQKMPFITSFERDGIQQVFFIKMKGLGGILPLYFYRYQLELYLLSNWTNLITRYWV